MPVNDGQPMSNTRLFEALLQEAERSFQRRLVVIAGGQEWGRGEVGGLASLIPAEESIWLSDSAEPCCGLEPVPFSRAKTLLGGECRLLIFDAWSGFDPNAFGIASGLVRGGGVLALLTPPLAQWGDFPDPQYRRIAVWPHAPEATRGQFLPRLSEFVAGSDQRVLLEEDGTVQFSAFLRGESVSRVPATSAEAPFATAEQQQAVEAVMKVLTGHRHRPLVLTADRGRGKSSAMGLAAAEMLRAGVGKVLVTAPSFEAVKPLFAMARRQLGMADESPAPPKRLATKRGELLFVAPDELAAMRPTAAMLLVDEAAGIPVNLLEQFLKAYSRVAFSTTVHGYEGTGRGFSVRFKERLDELAPQWTALEMHEPVRWAGNDPLEAFTAKALLLDAEPASLPHHVVEAFSPQALQMCWPTAEELAADDTVLRELFGLLVLAHYQTSPLDLRHLLDGENIRLCLALHSARVVGVAMLAVEGGFDESLEKAIFRGERRPQGHLFPQTLLAHAGIAGAGKVRGLRVVRIAVLPELQGKGIGSALLLEVEAWAREQGMGYVAASFGYTPSLLAFWRAAAYTAVHLGTRRNAGSGEHSLSLMKALDTQGEALLCRAAQAFDTDFPVLLGDVFQRLEPDWVMDLCAAFSAVSEISPLSQRDLDIVQAYAWHRRSYESSAVALGRLLRRSFPRLRILGDGAAVVIRKVLQQQGWEEVSAATGLSGRKAVEVALRSAFADLLEGATF